MKHRWTSVRSAVLLCALALASATVPTAAFAAASPSPARPLDEATLAAVPRLEIPADDPIRAVGPDAWNDRPGRPHRFAVPHPVHVTPATGGAWQREGAELVWRLRVRVPGALSLNLGFDRFELPPSARLVLVSVDGAHRVRPFTAEDEEVHGQLWTPVVATDDLLVELHVAPAERGAVRLSLARVNQGYRGFDKTATEKSSGGCNVDVVCPVGDPWRPQIRAVGLLQFDGSFFCSGSLLNDTANDRRPFFVTAAHCGLNTSAKAASAIVYWNYQNSVCRGEPGGSGPGDGTLDDFQSGAFYRAGWGGTGTSDFTLIELDDPVPAAANAFFAGWDRSTANYSSATAVHHPSSEEKRITFSTTATTTSSYFDQPAASDGTHLHVWWSLGVTEHGSSGSPLYNPQGRFVGQLHGGNSACGSSDESDYYGRLSASWEGGGTPATRLRDWLDPRGTNATAIDGLDPNVTLLRDGFESGEPAAWQVGP